jgi:hypothetical protein
MNFEKQLTLAKQSLAAIEAKQPAAQEAVAAAEKRRSAAVLDATLGDQQAQRELAAATVQRDSAVAHAQDVSLALTQATELVRSAERALLADTEATAVRRISKLGEQRGVLWDRIASLRAQMFEAFVEIQNAGAEISVASAGLPEEKLPSLKGMTLREFARGYYLDDTERFLGATVTGTLPAGLDFSPRLFAKAPRDVREIERAAWREFFTRS